MGLLQMELRAAGVRLSRIQCSESVCTYTCTHAHSFPPRREKGARFVFFLRLLLKLVVYPQAHPTVCAPEVAAAPTHTHTVQRIAP